VGSSVEVMDEGFGGDDAGVEGAVGEVGYGFGVVEKGEAGGAVLDGKLVERNYLLSVISTDVILTFPLFAPTVANPFIAPYAMSSYLIPGHC
jgi:hypothetical protein